MMNDKERSRPTVSFKDDYLRPSQPIQASFFMKIMTSPMSKRLGMIMMFAGAVSLAVVVNILVTGGPLLAALGATGLFYLAISSLFVAGVGSTPWFFKTAPPTRAPSKTLSSSSLPETKSNASMA